MSRYLISYVLTALSFLALDAVWLSTMALRLYRPLLGDMLLDGFRAGPALAFYAIYIAGICFFAFAPALADGDWKRAALNGALFGFFAYATYDLTNQATLRQWSTTVTVADMVWGAFVTGASASLGYLATVWLAPRAVA